MTLKELLACTEAENMTPEISLEKEVTCGYACDLLSWVMAHGKSGMAWVTVQTHMNVIAVASLLEMTAVLLPEGIAMEAASLARAKEEGIAVVQSRKTAFALCALMAQNGLPDAGTEA